MYVVTSIWFVRRTRATFRSAEFGFFGVCVNTRVQTPRFCGAPPSAGVFVFPFWRVRPLRTSWLTVGMNLLESLFSHSNGRRGRWPCQPDEAWYRNARGPANPENPLGKRNQKGSSGVFQVPAHDGFSYLQKLVRPTDRHYSESAGFSFPAANE